MWGASSPGVQRSLGGKNMRMGRRTHTPTRGFQWAIVAGFMSLAAAPACGDPGTTTTGADGSDGALTSDTTGGTTAAGGTTASGGTTATDSMGGTGGDSGCPPGQTECNGTCRILDFDPDNCGACGVTCMSGDVCSAGSCGLNCAGGTTECDGLCADTSIDPDNCGVCDKTCAVGEVCTDGKCATDCAGGTTKCDEKCVDANLDPNNCGICGNACAVGEACSDGECSTSCAAGTTKCDEKCVDTNIDPENCGMCGNTCAMGEACSCDGQCVDLKIDPDNCGVCGETCAVGEVCSKGECGPPGTPTGTTGCKNDSDCAEDICWSAKDYDPLCFGTICSLLCITDAQCHEAAADAGANNPNAAQCQGDNRCNFQGTGLIFIACA